MTPEAIVAVLAGLCRLNRRPNFAGTDPELVARLAELAMELSCPELARVLTCSPKAAQDGVRLAAQHTPIVIAGTRHALARVRLGECFEQVKAHPQRIVFAEGEEERVLRAVQVVVDEGLARPTLIEIGRAHV